MPKPFESRSGRGLERMRKRRCYVLLVVCVFVMACVSSVLYLYYPREWRLCIIMYPTSTKTNITDVVYSEL